MVEITIRPETPAELRAVAQLLSSLSNLAGTSSPVGADTRVSSSAPEAEPPAVSTATHDAVPPALAADIDIPGPPKGAPDPAYGPQQVLEALQDYARVNGAAALKEVLARFGARRASEIRPEHFAAVMSIARGT